MRRFRFLAKSWTQPFRKNKFFDYLKQHFYSLEKRRFHLKYKKNKTKLNFPKPKSGNFSNFIPKSWTSPFRNNLIFPLLSKKAFFLSKISQKQYFQVNFPLKQRLKIFQSFDVSLALSIFENIEFYNFFKITLFLGLEILIFYVQYQQSIYMS